jgi:hypothetical protein
LKYRACATRFISSRDIKKTKTRKTRLKNDSRAGCFMGHKAQNPLKSRGFQTKKKSRFFYQNLLSYLEKKSYIDRK